MNYRLKFLHSLCSPFISTISKHLRKPAGLPASYSFNSSTLLGARNLTSSVNSLLSSSSQVSSPLTLLRTGAVSFPPIFLSASCSISYSQKTLNRYALNKYNLRHVVIKKNTGKTALLFYLLGVTKFFPS